MLQIFRVAGIPVRIDASWLLVFGLLAWSLAAAYVPHALPDVTPGWAWVYGVTAALMLFVSVVLHELAHALVARRHGVRVRGIRLHVFGGVSELEPSSSSPPWDRSRASRWPRCSTVSAAWWPAPPGWPR